jgi:hypothetical protein
VESAHRMPKSVHGLWIRNRSLRCVFITIIPSSVNIKELKTLISSTGWDVLGLELNNYFVRNLILKAFDVQTTFKWNHKGNSRCLLEVSLENLNL